MLRAADRVSVLLAVALAVALRPRVWVGYGLVVSRPMSPTPAPLISADRMKSNIRTWMPEGPSPSSRLPPARPRSTSRPGLSPQIRSERVS